MSIEDRPDDHTDDTPEEDGRSDGPVKRADARIGSAGGGPYPLAGPDREEAERS